MAAVAGRLNRLAASRCFQAWAARMPVLRRLVRAEGAALFDLMAGFVYSQALRALVELAVLDALRAGPATVEQLAQRAAVPAARMAVLLQAGAALGLLRRRRDGRFALAPRGAAFVGVPGLADLVRHHSVLYRDLDDPAAFLRGETEPALAHFWPYVLGAGTPADPVAAARYSRLMSDSQALVAEEVLGQVTFRGIRHLLDVGGGTGAFLVAVGRAHPGLALSLFDLPAVVAEAASRLAAAGIADRVRIIPGNFRDAPLPAGADAISLVRVLYDHDDDTVAALLARVRAALPPGGRVIVAEPMGGGDRPDRATDGYFAFYCMAMGTGRVRPAAEIARQLGAAGFGAIRIRRGFRPYVASTVEARCPA